MAGLPGLVVACLRVDMSAILWSVACALAVGRGRRQVWADRRPALKPRPLPWGRPRPTLVEPRPISMSPLVAVTRVDLPQPQPEMAGVSQAAVITMDRPDARNAMSTQLLIELLDAIDDSEADPHAAGIVVTGAEGVFSAGADIREELADGGRRRMELFTVVYERLTLCHTPTVAVMVGAAVGGGVETAAACDLRVAEPSAWIRFPGAIHRIPVGTARTIGLVGLGTAKDWVMSARDVGRDELVSSGFVQRAVDDGHGMAAALEWLGLVASRDRDTVALLKRMFNDSSGLRDRTMFENDALRATAEAGQLPPGLDVDLPRTVRPRRR